MTRIEGKAVGALLALSLLVTSVAAVSATGADTAEGPSSGGPELSPLPHPGDGKEVPDGDLEDVDAAQLLAGGGLGCGSTIREVQESCSGWIAWEGARWEGNPLQARFMDSALSPDGDTLVFTGLAQVEHSPLFDLYHSDKLTVAIDVETGQVRWSALEGGDLFDGGYEVAFTPSGDRVVVAGTSGPHNFSREGDRGDKLTVTVRDPDAGSLEARLAENLDGYTSPESVEREGETTLEVGPQGDRAYISVETLAVGVDLREPAFLWQQAYDPSPHLDRPEALGLSPDGGTVYTLWTETTWDFPCKCEGGTNIAWTLRALDARTGELTWTTTYDPSAKIDAPFAMAIDPAGEHVYAAGTTDVDAWNGERGATVVGFDATTGDRAWGTRLTETDAYSMARSLALGPGGENLYVGGYDSDDALVTKLRASDGETLWISSFDRLADSVTYGYGVFGRYIEAGPDGERVHLFVAARPDGVPQARLVGGNAEPVWRGYDTTLVTFDAGSGEVAWNASLGTDMSYPEYPRASLFDGRADIHPTPDGERVLLTGNDLHPDYVGQAPRQMVAVSYPADGPTPSLVPDAVAGTGIG